MFESLNRVRIERRVGRAPSRRTDDQTRRKRIEFPGKSAFVYSWPREGSLFVFGSPLINVCTWKPGIVFFLLALHDTWVHRWLRTRPPLFPPRSLSPLALLPPPPSFHHRSLPPPSRISAKISTDINARTDFLSSFRKTLVSKYTFLERDK